jgi:hypothetical protein
LYALSFSHRPKSLYQFRQELTYAARDVVLFDGLFHIKGARNEVRRPRAVNHVTDLLSGGCDVPTKSVRFVKPRKQSNRNWPEPWPRRGDRRAHEDCTFDVLFAETD